MHFYNILTVGQFSRKLSHIIIILYIHSRRTALLKGRNTRTIQLPLRHLKGIGIGMTPLSDWLNVLPRGSGIAGVTELHYHPKVCHGMLYCTSITKMCMQHVYSTHVRDLHKTIHFTCKAWHGDPTVVYSSPFSFVTCLLNIGVSSVNLMYKKASLSGHRL